MKAKEYAARLEAEGITNASVGKMAIAMMAEVHTIGKQRDVRHNSALFSILDEQDLKWQAVRRLVPSLKAEGFQISVKTAMPIIYAAWKEYRASKGRHLYELQGLIT